MAHKEELLIKLKALAERGEDGERENARRILQRLLEKYNIAEADLEEDALSEHSFRASGARARDLLVQVCFKVTNGDRRIYHYSKGKGARNTVYCMCTKAEAIQIAFEHDFYLELWKEEEDLFFRSFIQKHKIFDDKPGPGEGKTLTPGELLRMKLMMSTMQDKTPTIMIEGA